VGVGLTSPGTTLDVYKSVNGDNTVRAYNPNTGTAAYGGFVMGTNDSGNRGGIIAFNSTWTASAQYRASGTYVYCNGAGGITLHAEGANNLFFATNSVERMRIDSSGNVGIGTATPTRPLVVNRIAGGGANNPAIMIGNNGIAGGLRFQTYDLAQQADAYMGLGTDMGGNSFEHSLVFPAPTTPGYVGTARQTIGSYDGTTYSTKMTILQSGFVGIGTSSPIAGLHVRTTTQTSLYTEQYSGVGNQGSGIQCWNTNIFSPTIDNQMSCGWSSIRWTTVYATTGTINTSDSRQKMNISPSNLGLNFISNLNPVSYSWIDGGTPATEPNVVGARPGKRTFYGFLAQDVKKTLDAMDTGDFAGWTLDDPKDPDSTQGLRYTEFIAPMVKAIQELSAKNTVLEQSLASATARLDSLESRLTAAGL
jgi:hypothetical protein